MSLADELLADFEDDDVEHNAGDDEMDVIAEVDEVVPEVDYRSKESVKHIAKLRDGPDLARIMTEIKKYAGQPRREKVAGPVEADPEYQLIVEANNITVEIDNEINVIHKFTRDHYSKRFPELESLVPTPLEYIRTVQELGNNILENSKSNEVLQEILTPATIMVVSVTASTTQGSELSPEELAVVNEACKMAVDLTECKAKIFEYVESRMSFIAPNLSIIVGASIAAKLMGIAGGLTNLSKMPACNIQILGAQKRTLSGFSTAAVLPHTGHVYYSEIVQKTPPDLRKKAARLVAAKCTLAARVDSFHESVDGAIGDSLRAEIEQKLDKLQEPPPVKTVKPLPAPIEQSRKRRGGRRARKMKERLGLTEVRKAANRMNFGEIEEDAYQDDLGFSLGALGKSQSGKIRGPVVDSKTKARISKTLQAKVQKQNNVWGGSTTVKRQIAGTASSVAFTPLQGLEIVNPQAAERKVQAANAKYFSSTAGFHKLKKEET
ncbi:U4/U6 small nuclear ribonucleoprotein Prp31-like [Saccostrea cucullata]|uniref:U4/U6 small nuclear ribonucleoprotein Prp31-like n=1 Tax=Saccostrea cuccullata TaxID=36930 RepID=UPI002ED5E5F3